MAITQTITGFSGPPPSTSDPTDFDARASTTLAEMAVLPGEVNTWAGQANTLADQVNGYADTASTAATAAGEALDAVLSQGTTASAWSSGVTYSQYQVAIGSDGRAYRSLAGSNTNHNPVTDTGTWWLALNPPLYLLQMILAGGDLYPGWSFQAQGPVGTYPPADPAKPACVVWSSGVYRLRVSYTWGTTGGGINSPATVVLEWSVNSGSSYAAVTATNKLTLTYDSSGAVIAGAWSAA